MTDDPAYFLYHSIGQYPGKAEEMAGALKHFSDVWGAMDDAQWGKMLGERQVFLDLWRAQIGAPEGSLTSAENVTAALFSVLTGLPADRLRGKRVLVTEDCFPSLHFMLAGMAERLDYTLDTVPLRQGDTWVRSEDMIAAWGPDVGLGLVTWITSTASYRTDVAALVDHGHRMGSLVGVDLTQGIGLIPFSVEETQADFCVSTSLKWLCATPGAGVIQMRPELIEEVTPDLRGWFSQPNPFSWDLDAFSFAPDARRFDNGTPSVLACVGSVPAMRWHAGQAGLWDQNHELVEMIIEEARKAKVQLASPTDRAERGGSVMLRMGSAEEAGRAVAGLRERGVYLDARGATLRMSPGIITDARHVERLFAGLHELI